MINHILITGCTSGLGHALAVSFSETNCLVYAVGRNTELMSQIFANHPNVVPIIADITKPEDQEKIFNAIDKTKPLSVIHNAGVAKPCLLSAMNTTLLHEHFETNVLAPMIMTQKLLPYMEGQRNLFISSGAAQMDITGLAPYCASKAALDRFVSCWKEELKGKVCFSTLRPGIMDTAMIEKFCHTDAAILPSQSFYVEKTCEEKLIPPEIAADFIKWVMIGTNNADFSKNNWSIYDTEHHAYWLQGDDLYHKENKTSSLSCKR